MNESRLKTAVKETNLPMLLVCMLTSMLGVLAVMSATNNQNTEGELLSRDANVMLISVAVGIAGCLFISFLDYEVLTRKWFIIAILIFCIGIMLALKIPGIGAAPPGRPDSRIWIKFGSYYFQPSELVKLGFVMSLSTHLAVIEKEINNPRQLALLLLHGGVFIALVAFSGDMGSALVFMAIFVGLLFMAGVKWYYFVGALMLSCAAAPIAWLKVFGAYQKERFIAVYPNFFALFGETISQEKYNEVIYQQQNGVNAVSGGGFWGQGLFNGEYSQQKGMIPVSESDMIFAVIGEELGFVGAAALFILLTAIIVCCVFAARKSRDNIGKLICGGIALMIGVQAIVNIGMCLKFLPCIGITLPFISAGGSSNLCVWLAVGIVMSISRQSQEHGPTRVRFIKGAR